MSTYSHTDLWDDEVSSRFCPFNDRLAAVDDPQARLERRRLFRHIIVSPLRTGVGWIVHEPSAVTKLRLLPLTASQLDGVFSGGAGEGAAPPPACRSVLPPKLLFDRSVTGLTHLSRFPSLKSSLATSGARRQTWH